VKRALTHAANGLANIEKEGGKDITKIMIAFRDYAKLPSFESTKIQVRPAFCVI